MVATLDFSKLNGLIPVIAQDAESLEILMQAYVNEEALQKTLETKKAYYFSRSKQRLWMKGEQSGHTQDVLEILVDCDQDSLIYKVQQHGGAACHKGYSSCFYRSLEPSTSSLQTIKTTKVFDPSEKYKN